MGKRRCGRSKRRKRSCCRPGKLTRNPFLNFLREFRKAHCDWCPTKIAVEGAKCWCRLTECQKQKYRQQACSAPRTKRCRKKKRRRSCKKKRRRCPKKRRKSKCRRRRCG